MIVGAILGAIASGIALAVTPFLIISDTVNAAIVAGVFSVINTALNLMIKRDASAAKRMAEANHDIATDVKNIVDSRHNDESPNPSRREED